jgi:hypothetical protein
MPLGSTSRPKICEEGRLVTVTVAGMATGNWKGNRVNKRKKVAWHKHLRAQKKKEEQRKAEAGTARR